MSDEQAAAQHQETIFNRAEMQQVLEAVSGKEGVAEVAKAAKIMDAADAKAAADEAVDAPAEEIIKAEDSAAAEKESQVEEKSAVEDTAAAEEPENKYKTWDAVKTAEKRNRVLRDQMRQEKTALEAARKELETQQAQFKQQYDELTNEPLKALEKRGVSFEDMARRVLADGKTSPEEAIKRLAVEFKDKFSALEKNTQELRDSVTQREQQQYITDYRNGISQALQTPAFELLSGYPDAAEEIFQLASTWAQQRQEVLTPDRAAAMIQDELKERLTKLKSHKAVRSFLGLPVEDDEAKSSPGVSLTPKRAASPKTLSNKHLAAPSKSEPDDEFVSEAEEIRRAAKLIAPDAWKGRS